MKELRSNAVSTMSYTVIERFIEKFEQKSRRATYLITLHAEKVITENHTFQIKDVLDISYKPFSGIQGLLYLHTNQGVFMFQVDANPNEFIQLFKKIRTSIR